MNYKAADKIITLGYLNELSSGGYVRDDSGNTITVRSYTNCTDEEWKTLSAYCPTVKELNESKYFPSHQSNNGDLRNDVDGVVLYNNQYRTAKGEVAYSDDNLIRCSDIALVHTRLTSVELGPNTNLSPCKQTVELLNICMYLRTALLHDTSTSQSRYDFGQGIVNKDNDIYFIGSHDGFTLVANNIVSAEKNISMPSSSVGEDAHSSTSERKCTLQSETSYKGDTMESNEVTITQEGATVSLAWTQDNLQEYLDESCDSCGDGYCIKKEGTDSSVTVFACNGQYYRITNAELEQLEGDEPTDCSVTYSNSQVDVKIGDYTAYNNPQSTERKFLLSVTVVNDCGDTNTYQSKPFCQKRVINENIDVDADGMCYMKSLWFNVGQVVKCGADNVAQPTSES